MKIRISLPDNRDFAGRLELLGASGAVIFGPVPAAGRAHDLLASSHGNAARSPLRPYGDTPLGTYAVRGVVGGMVLLEPASGQAALADAHGRRRFFIQGGDDHLRAIAGNISLCDADQKDFVALVRRAAEELECEIIATAEQGEKVSLGRPPVTRDLLGEVCHDEGRVPRTVVVAETSGAGGGGTTYSGGAPGAGTGTQNPQSGPDDTTVGPLPTTGTDVAPQPGVDLNLPDNSIVKFYQMPPTAQLFPAATQTGFTPVLNVNVGGWMTFSLGVPSDPYSNTPGGGPNTPYTGSPTGPYSNIQPDNLNPNSYTGAQQPIEPFSNTDSPGTGTGTGTGTNTPAAGQQRDTTDNPDTQIQDMVRIFAQQDAQLQQQQQQAQQQQQQQQEQPPPPQQPQQQPQSAQASQPPTGQPGQQSGAANAPNFPGDALTLGPAPVVGTIGGQASLPPGGVTTGVPSMPGIQPPPPDAQPPPDVPPPPRVESTGAWVRANPSQAADAAIREQIALGFLDPSLAGRNVSTATAQTEGSISRLIRAQTGEMSAYDYRLSQGEVGILAPKGASVRGLDYATASRLPNGDWQINVGDAASRYTDNPFKTSPGTAKPAWQAELAEPFSYKPGGPRTGSFSLPNDPVTEQAIREAYAAGRISVVQIDTIDFSAQGQGRMTVNGAAVPRDPINPSPRSAVEEIVNPLPGGGVADPAQPIPVAETADPVVGGAGVGAAVATVFTAIDILMNPDAHPDAARELATMAFAGGASGGLGTAIGRAVVPALTAGESSFFGEVLGGGIAGGPAAGLFTGLAMLLDDQEHTATDYEAKISRSVVDGTVGGLVGVAAAEATGAAIGTFIPIPGVGTAVGFAAGYVGYKLADWLFGDSVEEAVRGEPEGPMGDFEIAEDPSGFLSG